MRNISEEYKQVYFAIKQISYKESRKRISETQLGLLWNVIDPLIYMSVLSIYYQNIFRHDIDKFPVYVFIGIITFSFFKKSTIGAMRSLVDNKSLIIRTSLPFEVFIYQKIYISFKEFVYSCIALFVVMTVFSVHIGINFFWLLPDMVLIILIVLGVGKVLSIMYVMFADIDYLYNILMTMVFFVSEIFVPIEKMPSYIQPVLKQNPIYLFVRITRNILLYNKQSEWYEWSKLLLWAIVLSVIGSLYYKKNINKIIEII